MNPKPISLRTLRSVALAAALLICFSLPLVAVPGGNGGNGKKELEGDNPSQISGIIGSMGGGPSGGKTGQNKGGGSGGNGSGGNGSGG